MMQQDSGFTAFCISFIFEQAVIIADDVASVIDKSAQTFSQTTQSHCKADPYKLI